MKQSRSVCESRLATVSARSLLYKLCGSSQPSIIRGSDDAFYVVKLNGFPGQQSLANEVVGAGLIQAMGLPTPGWVQIDVSDNFIDENPGLWFNDGHAKIKPQAGLHFGSRLIEAPDDQCTYQMIPHSWISRIENRTDFLGMLVLDLWANNCDRRQAVFLSDAQMQLHATFIDNDFMFGGKFGSDSTCPRRAMVYDLDIYRGLWIEETVEQWVCKINDITEAEIRRIVDYVPSVWTSQSTRVDIVRQLGDRCALLPRLLRDAGNVLKSGYTVKYDRPRYATEPGQFHTASVFPALQ